MAAPTLAFLLDLDGTLVDSEPGILASCQAALLALGHRPDGLSVAGMIGPPLEEIMATMLARFGDDRVAEGVLAYREHYGSTGFRATTVYPGVAALLDRLAAMGMSLYVATAKRRIFAQRILQHLGLAAHFAGVHGSEPGGALDRKTDLIAHVLRHHGLRAERCLMVGDRRQDVLGGRANGLSTVGVLWGYGDRDELASAGAEHIIARPADLVAIAEARAMPGAAPGRT